MASDEPPRFHIVYWHNVDAGDGSGSMVVRFDVPAMSYKGAVLRGCMEAHWGQCGMEAFWPPRRPASAQRSNRFAPRTLPPPPVFKLVRHVTKMPLISVAFLISARHKDHYPPGIL
jgi:hypothetical protein